MGIETRNGRQYYYQKEWNGGRVQSRYIGPVGSSLATYAQRLADSVAAVRTLERQQRQDAAAHAHCYDTLDAALTRYSAALLLAAGWHRQWRSWRKRRPMAKKQHKRIDLPPRPAEGDTSLDALVALMQRCDRAAAEPEDVQRLKRLLPTHPMILAVGDQMAMALQGRHDGMPTRKHIAETYQEQRLRALGYAAADPLHRPLLLHIVLCEQRLGDYELLAAGCFKAGKGVEQALKLLERTQRLYVRAVETYAKLTSTRIELSETKDGRTRAVAVETPARRKD